MSTFTMVNYGNIIGIVLVVIFAIFQAGRQIVSFQPFLQQSPFVSTYNHSHSLVAVRG